MSTHPLYLFMNCRSLSYAIRSVSVCIYIYIYCNLRYSIKCSISIYNASSSRFYKLFTVFFTWFFLLHFVFYNSCLGLSVLEKNSYFLLLNFSFFFHSFKKFLPYVYFCTFQQYVYLFLPLPS